MFIELRFETIDGDGVCLLMGRTTVCLPFVPNCENRKRQAIRRQQKERDSLCSLLDISGE